MAQGKSQLREFIEQIAIAAVLAFFIITFVMQSFIVDGPSMEPSFYDRERLFVNKFIYRFRDPVRGEVIVFDPSLPNSKPFIKRVIGLPGEIVHLRDGAVFIDGEPLSEDYIKDMPLRNYGPYEVGQDEYFVLGDNRSNSSDSRFSQVGMVNIDDITGKAFWAYWPINRMRIIWLPEY